MVSANLCQVRHRLADCVITASQEPAEELCIDDDGAWNVFVMIVV